MQRHSRLWKEAITLSAEQRLPGYWAARKSGAEMRNEWEMAHLMAAKLVASAEAHGMAKDQ